MPTVEFNLADGSPRVSRTASVPTFAACTVILECAITSYENFADLVAITGTLNEYLLLEAAADGSLYITTQDDGAANNTSNLWTDTYTGRFWVALVCNGTTVQTYYQRFGGSFTTSASLTLTGMAFTPDSIIYGAAENFLTDSEGTFNYGAIKEFSAALTSSEIQQEFTQRMAVRTLNLTFANDCHNATGNNAVNINQTGGTNGTLTGTPTTLTTGQPGAPWRRSRPREVLAADAGNSLTLAGVLAGLEAAATVAETIPGTLAGALAGLTAAATVAAGTVCTLAGTLAGLTGAATVTETIPSTCAGALAGLTASVTALESNIPGDFLEASLTMTETIPCTVAGSLAGLVCAATAAESIPSTLAGVLPGLVAALTATHTAGGEVTGTLAATLPGLEVAATMSEAIPGTMAASLPGLEGALAVSETIPCTLAAELPGLTAALTMSHGLEEVTGTLAAALPGLEGAATMSETIPCTLAAELAGLTCAAVVTSASPVSMTIAATLPGLVMSADVSFPVAPEAGGSSRRRSRSRYRPRS